MSAASVCLVACLAAVVEAEAVPDGYAVVVVVLPTKVTVDAAAAAGAAGPLIELVAASYPPAPMLEIARVLEGVARSVREGDGQVTVAKGNDAGSWDVPRAPEKH